MDKAIPKTRDKIISAACKLFGEQGYAQTTISQIAKEGEISEPTIYEYFRGKEELLLEIPVRWTRDNLPLIQDSLFGVKGALNQLRKYLWEYCRIITRDPQYARVVFFELKAKKSFLTTEAFHEVQVFYRQIIDIIQEGQRSGELKPNLDPYYARMVIIGTIEHMTIRWLLKDCAYDLFDQLEGVFEIIEDGLRVRQLDMVLRERTVSNNASASRSELLEMGGGKAADSGQRR